MPALITVVEEVLSGNRLMYMERKDLQMQSRLKLPSEMKKEAVEKLRAKGLVVIAANFTRQDGKAIQVIVKHPTAARPPSKRPVYKGDVLPPRRR